MAPKAKAAMKARARPKAKGKAKAAPGRAPRMRVARPAARVRIRAGGMRRPAAANPTPQEVWQSGGTVQVHRLGLGEFASGQHIVLEEAYYFGNQVQVAGKDPIQG